MAAVCPVCGTTMEEGTIYAQRYIWWLPLGKRVSMWKGPLGNEILTRTGAFRPRGVPARRCRPCRRVEFGYGGTDEPFSKTLPWVNG